MLTNQVIKLIFTLSLCYYTHLYVPLKQEVILFSAMKPQNKSVPVKNAGQVGVDKRKSQDNAGKGFINSMKSLELRAKKPRSGERKL